MSARLFIRNDDACRLDSAFRFFFELARDHEIPVVHAVIPGKLEKSLIRFLCRAKEKTPQLLDIVQHGWLHANHCVDGKTKFEFGASRTYSMQREDIRLGQKKMRQAFGGYFTRAFVPPYHGYDQRTWRVLGEEGFQVFSGGAPRAGLKKGIMEIPAEVSFSRYDKGRKSIYPAKEVLGKLARGIHRRPICGVVTHHADFKTMASHKELERFFKCVAGLKSKEGWRVLLFSDILSVTRGK